MADKELEAGKITIRADLDAAIDGLKPRALPLAEKPRDMIVSDGPISLGDRGTYIPSSTKEFAVMSREIGKGDATVHDGLDTYARGPLQSDKSPESVEKLAKTIPDSMVVADTVLSRPAAGTAAAARYVVEAATSPTKPQAELAERILGGDDKGVSISGDETPSWAKHSIRQRGQGNNKGGSGRGT